MTHTHTPSPPAPSSAAPLATVSRHAAFDKVCAAGRKLFVQKNEEYGDAIAATGVLGAAVELIGVTARLRPLVLHDPKHGASNRDSLIDIFKDLHNYATIGLMMLAEDNWDGK